MKMKSLGDRCRCLLVVTLCSLVTSYPQRGLKGKRNVLLIVGDDAGFETQVYGNRMIQTPGLNYLANRSVVFHNAYTSVSSCSPSSFSSNPDLKFPSLKELLKGAAQYCESTEDIGIVGKKHVGPEEVYPFDYEVTEEQISILQAGRNITFMKEKVQQFFNGTENDQPFFLYIGFHDPHRCGSVHPQYGEFCEKFGNGEPGMGNIPDWVPQPYNPNDVVVPYFVPDTPEARRDIAAQYTTVGRMDQGILLILQELEKAGHLDDTLIIYTSDNGIPFPSGRTNLYSAGMAEPFMMSSPDGKSKWGKGCSDLVSLLDIVPTVLDWFDVKYPSYKLEGNHVNLTGQSLLPLVSDDGYSLSEQVLRVKKSYKSRESVFASHDLHEITMFYPMRSVRTLKHHLIHNLNFKMPFPIDQDFFVSPTYQGILNRTRQGLPLHWYKTLDQYYYRPEWELYDLHYDSQEWFNMATNPAYSSVLSELQAKLKEWQNITADPWICAPGGVLEYQGKYKGKPQCLSLENGLGSSEDSSFGEDVSSRVENSQTSRMMSSDGTTLPSNVIRRLRMVSYDDNSYWYRPFYPAKVFTPLQNPLGIEVIAIEFLRYAVCCMFICIFYFKVYKIWSSGNVCTQ